jgi:hypothetical protein
LSGVDGCTVNARKWFFAAGLTNVQVELTVTDSRSGQIKTYSNPQNTPFRTIEDTDSFASCAQTVGLKRTK